MRLLIALPLILVALQAHADGLDWAIVGTSSLDLATTEIAIDRGYRELNPLMQTRAARIGIKVASAASIIALRHELKRTGHKRAAKVAGVLIAGLYAGLATHNVVLIVRH